MKDAMPAEPDNSYVIRFTALGAQVLPDEAADLLRQAHAAAEWMGIPEAEQIRSIQEREGLEN